MINKRILWALTVLLVISLLSVVVFARPPQVVCCDSINDCVIWEWCFASGTSPWDVDGDGDADYCLTGEWWDCGTEGSTAQCLSGWECDANHDCVLSCADIGDSCSSDSDCCSGVPCDDPVENGGNKCGCPTDYTWQGGECVYQPDTCEDGPPASIECDVPSYMNGFCLFPSNPTYTQSCCYASSYGGIDYYEKEYVVVITV